MFVHGETNPGTTPANDNEVTVFVRLGTDFVSNYYEYEMPLKISPGITTMITLFGPKKTIW